MSKHRQILYGQPIPESFLDALQEIHPARWVRRTWT